MKKVEIQIKDLSWIISQWASNKADGYFAYVEGESDSTYFEHFLPQSSFLLGLKNDDKMKNLITNINSAPDISRIAELSQKASLHMETLLTYKPILYPKVYLVLSKKYRLATVGNRAAYQLPLSELRQGKF